MSVDPRSAPRRASAESFDADENFDARPGWGEVLVTTALAAVAVLLVVFFAFVIGMA